MERTANTVIFSFFLSISICFLVLFFFIRKQNNLQERIQLDKRKNLFVFRCAIDPVSDYTLFPIRLFLYILN